MKNARTITKINNSNKERKIVVREKRKINRKSRF